MVQWRLVCGLAALYAAGTVKADPIELDKTETPDELITMDENFPGKGTFREADATATSATLSTGSKPGETYNPGELHARRVDRRLEVTKSTDMQKLETFFGLELETDITKLPTKYQHDPIPWPASYWPVYADSINYKWAKGKPSPAEKYANAFGYDAKELMDKISAKNGIDSQTKRKVCTTDAECKLLKDGSVCAKREGKTSGHCIPTWFGICHAWAPAAILEAEPACAVERNGTVFEPYDIKGLITLAYDGSKIPTIFTGSRFNGNDNAPNNTDQYGRFFDDRRRDVSPGYFHVAVTNIMGRFNHSFVIDITAGNEVWNQPARSYEILRLSWTTPTAAAKKYFDVDKYPFNDAATKIAVVTTRFSWIVESGTNGPLVSTGLVDKSTTSADYEYILETDETYQILGGEWLSGSKANHPDFIWLPASKPDNSTITSVGLHYAEIEALLDESTSGSGDCKAVSQTSTAAPAPESPATSTESSAAGSAPAASGDDEPETPASSGNGSNPAASGDDEPETPASSGNGNGSGPAASGDDEPETPASSGNGNGSGPAASGDDEPEAPAGTPAPASSGATPAPAPGDDEPEAPVGTPAPASSGDGATPAPASNAGSAPADSGDDEPENPTEAPAAPSS